MKPDDRDRMNALVRECHEHKAQRDAALEEAGRLSQENAALRAEVESLRQLAYAPEE